MDSAGDRLVVSTQWRTPLIVRTKRFDGPADPFLLSRYAKWDMCREARFKPQLKRVGTLATPERPRLKT